MRSNRIYAIIRLANGKRAPHVKSMKVELLGIGVILLGIALSTNNFWAYTLGAVGFGVISIGAFLKDRDK